MEDHDTGAGAPEVGVSRASPPPSGQASPSAGRHNGRPVQPWSGHEQAGDASQHQNGQKAKTRKRRKRRRGRKVFARDDARLAAAGVAAAAVSAPASRPPAAIVAPLPSVAPGRPELGTNNCRLLVAVPTRHGQFRVIDAFSRIVRLGEGLTANGRLGQPAMDRAVEALKICGDKLRNRKIRKARLIATEACRTAAN
ncbi:MAG: Ppx/GppA family phosphatase, partial [Mesorhizobium sp.]